MQKPPIPKNEEARLQSLQELELLDNYKHELFEGAADLAAEVFGCSIALVSLIDTDRQWFAAKHNFTVDETPRDVSFCGHAIINRDVMVVPDARIDSRFRDNPLVTNESPVVFYAGAPLITPDNLALGTLCVIDHEPKYPSERQVRTLEQLAKFVVDQMELRRAMLRQEKNALESERNHRAQARRLRDISQDLHTALSGIVAVSTQLADKTNDTSDMNSLSTLRYSANSLMQIVDQLAVDSLLSLSGQNLTLSNVDPLTVAAATIAAFNAETDQRNIHTRISSDSGSNVWLFTDQERLRACLFHAVGFLVAQLNSGELDIRLTPGARENTLCFAFSATGDLTADPQLEVWKQALQDDNDVLDLPMVRSLFSMRGLAIDLKGKVAIDGIDNKLTLNLTIPVNLGSA